MTETARIVPVRSFVLYLVRHAESRANAGLHRPEDGTNTSLSPKGIEEAKALAPYLTRLGITHVGSSDLRRAMETRDILLAGTSGKIVLPPSPLLRELSRGDDQYGGFPEDLRRYMSLMGPYYKSPNGDSSCDIATRYLDWIYQTMGTIQRDVTYNTRLMLIGHGNAIKATLHAMLGLDPRASAFASPPIRNTVVTTLYFHPTDPPDYRTAWSLAGYNEAPHRGITA